MAIWALALSNALAAIGITIVVPIMGIAADIFGTDQASSMWLVTGFMLTYAAFMPIIGRLSDAYGRKKIFVLSNLIFSAGLAVSSISGNFLSVVIGRMLQGAGAGGILPVANAMVVELMAEKKEKGLSIINATYGIGMIGGINLGGFVYDAFGWRALFYIPALLSLSVTIFAALSLTETKRIEKGVKIDLLGSLSFAAFVMLFMLGMKNIGKEPLLSPKVWGYLAASALSFIVFLAAELKSKHPAIDLKKFSSPDYTIYNIVALLFGMGMFTLIPFMAPFVQLLLGYDVSTSVWAVDPFALAMIIFVPLGGALSRKIGARASITIAMAILGASALLYSIFTKDTLSFYALSVLLSVGFGLAMTPLNHIVIESGGKEGQGESAGMVSIMRSLGGVIGPTIAGIILSRVDFSSLFAVDNILAAYSKIFLISGFVALAGALVSLAGQIVNKKHLKTAQQEGE